MKTVKQFVKQNPDMSGRLKSGLLNPNKEQNPYKYIDEIKDWMSFYRLKGLSHKLWEEFKNLRNIK